MAKKTYGSGKGDKYSTSKRNMNAKNTCTYQGGIFSNPILPSPCYPNPFHSEEAMGVTEETGPICTESVEVTGSLYPELSELADSLYMELVGAPDLSCTELTGEIDQMCTECPGTHESIVCENVRDKEQSRSTLYEYNRRNLGGSHQTICFKWPRESENNCNMGQDYGWNDSDWKFSGRYKYFI